MATQLTRLVAYVDPPVADEVTDAAHKARLTVSTFLREYFKEQFPTRKRRKVKKGGVTVNA